MPEIKAGTTDVTTCIKLVDPSSGDEETGLTISDLTMWYHRAKTAVVSAAATQGSSVSAAHVDNRMFEVHSAACPGLYRCDWPDAAFAAGVDRVIVGVKGAAVDTAMEGFVLKDFDISDIEDYVSDIYSDTVHITSDLTLTALSSLATAAAVATISGELANATYGLDALETLGSDAISTLDAWVGAGGVLSDIQSDTGKVVSDLTATSLSDLATAAAVSDVKSELVIVSDAISTIDAAIDSDSLLYISDLSDIISELATGPLSTIASDTAAIEGAGGGLTAAQASQLTQIQSDVIVLDAAIDSDSLLYMSDLSDILSELATGALSTIASDTAAIEAAGGALTTAQASQLSQVHSDVVKTDLSDLSAEMSNIGSDLIALSAEVSDIYSDTAGLPAQVVSNLMANNPTAGSSTVADILKAIFAMARGKFIRNGGSYAFYDDDATLLFTITIADPNRTTA